MTRARDALSRPTTECPDERAGAWLSPWTDDDDLSDWESVEVEPGTPHERGGSTFALDLDPVLTSWLYKRAEMAGCSPIDYLRRLLDADRQSAGASQPHSGE
jgi:hypothetical protein